MDRSVNDVLFLDINRTILQNTVILNLSVLHQIKRDSKCRTSISNQLQRCRDLESKNKWRLEVSMDWTWAGQGEGQASCPTAPLPPYPPRPTSLCCHTSPSVPHRIVKPLIGVGIKAHVQLFRYWEWARGFEANHRFWMMGS